MTIDKHEIHQESDPIETPSARVDRLRAQMISDGSIFAPSFVQIGRTFLSGYWSEDCSTQSFSEIRERVMGDESLEMFSDEVEKREIKIEGQESPLTVNVIKSVTPPADEEELFKLLCEQFLFIAELPRNHLLKIYLDATSHLSEIKSNISTLEGARRRIKATLDSDPHKRLQTLDPLLEYYCSMNREAQQEIFAFLEDAPTLRSNALNLAAPKRWKSLYSILHLSEPYSYARWPRPYQVRHYSDLSHKLRKLTIRELQKVRVAYSRSNLPTLIYGAALEELTELRGAEEVDGDSERNFVEEKVSEYIRSMGISAGISVQIDQHHRLNSRRKVLASALEAYDGGEFHIFCNLVPLQIEGLFHDICLDAGLIDPVGPKHTLRPKVEMVANALGLFNYPYYAFRFPQIRNKIAHGMMDLELSQNLANMLLLDLHHMCEVVGSNEVPVNRAVELRRQLRETPSAPPLILKNLIIESYSELSAYSRWRIPDFYRLDSVISIVGSGLQDEKFLSYLLKLIESGSTAESMVLDGLEKALAKLKEYDSNRAVELLRALGRARITGKRGQSVAFHLFDFLRWVDFPGREVGGSRGK